MIVRAPNWHGNSVVGPMGSKTGLGDAPLGQAVNCPGPGCSAGDASQATDPNYQGQIASIWDYLAMNTPGAQSSPSSTWIPGIPNVAVGIGGAALALMLFGMGRR